MAVLYRVVSPAVGNESQPVVTLCQSIVMHVIPAGRSRRCGPWRTFRSRQSALNVVDFRLAPCPLHELWDVRSVVSTINVYRSPLIEGSFMTEASVRVAACTLAPSTIRDALSPKASAISLPP
jgi:hypothetical protein